MKKHIKWLILIVLIIICIHTALRLVFGPIDYSGTFSTKYKHSDTYQTIITKHFEIETPKNWIHIFHGYGVEGEAWGFFLTELGSIAYEYGAFSNTFQVDSINTFSKDSLTTGRFKIYLGKNENNETGIYIPRQHEMEWPFSFFMSKACTENLNSIITGIKNMKFKKFYNFWPELDNAIAYFKNHWNEEEIDTFRSKSEEEAVSTLHFSTGMWIRNNWLRNPKDSSLVKFFYSLGIFHPDDMSSIILTSLHRDLNGKFIDLNSQLIPFQEYWNRIYECKETQKRQAVENFEKIKLGDNILIYMPVDTSYHERNAIQYACPNTDWSFNSKKDLFVNGLVVNKFYINDTSNVFLGVQILEMNNKNTTILGKDVEVGDIIDFSLTGLRIGK